MSGSLFQKYGGWAVVAGASEGMGAEFARQLANQGFNLLLIARREEELLKRKSEMEGNTEVKIFVADLSKREDLDKIKSEVRQLEVGLFVYNAVFPLLGYFLDKPVEDHEMLIKVNCIAPMLLTHYIGNQMIKRRKGGIILMSSMAGMQGSAVVAHYAASKAYNRVLAEGLWYELKSLGVDVISVIAGATSTPNFIQSQPKKASAGSPPVMKPEEVVREALARIGRKPSFVTGRMNRLASWFMTKVFTRKRAITIISNATTKMYPHYLNEQKKDPHK